MKITVDKKKLEAALQVVSNSMSGTETDMSSQLVFRPVAGSSDKVEVLTFSGRLFSSCPFEATVEDAASNPDGAFTVEGSRMKQWLRSVSSSSLELSYDPEGKIVTAKVPRGSQEFRSLDPKDFPYWDDLLSKVDTTTTLPAGSLVDALTFVRPFIGDSKMETTAPQHCVTEVRDGAFLANDKRAACMVQVKGLEGVSIRLFTGDVGSVLKFLGSVPHDQEVEVLEHPKGFLFQRSDGALFGETKYQVAFPPMALPLDWDDEFWWSLPKDELKSAIPFLMSGADAEDNRLYFSRKEVDGPISLGMMATTDNLKTLEITPLDSGCAQGKEEDSVYEFQISVSCLQKVISGTVGDVVRFGINSRKGTGFVRFQEDRGEDKYLTVMAWLRK